MSAEDDLFKAYMILSLEPGTEWKTILARFKTCVRVWHPDRAPEEAAWKQEATEELKKLNWARDVLKQHFENGNHSASGSCACRQKKNAEPERPPAGSDPGGKNRASNEPPDFSAFTRGQTQSQAEKDEPKDSSESRMQEAMNEKSRLHDQSLRWKVATALGIAYVSLCLFGMAAHSAKDTWSEWTKGWQTKEVPKASEPAPIQSTQPPPYVPAYNQFPGGNSSSWQSQQNEDRKHREEAALKKHDQDLYFAKLEVDKYETSIAYNNNEITQIDIKLTNPQMAVTTRRQLLDIREYRLKSLGEAQSFLKAAQEKARALDPSYMPSQPALPYTGNAAPSGSTSSTSSLRDRLKDRKLFP